MKKEKALVLFSGGLDSTTALAMAVDKYGAENVIALSMSYGQKHIKEIEASNNVAAYYRVEHISLDLARIFEYSNCSLLAASDKEVPKGSYEEQLGGEMKVSSDSIDEETGLLSTYVPFRNGLFISCAASIALSKGASVIYYGAHADDAAGNAYPDCSEAFNNAINEAVYVGSGNNLRVEAPFVGITKADVVGIGLKLKVPYGLTWSCYEGKEKPCGCCGTCIDRIKAFRLNGIEDPLEY